MEVDLLIQVEVDLLIQAVVDLLIQAVVDLLIRAVLEAVDINKGTFAFLKWFMPFYWSKLVLISYYQEPMS